jgi:hypothetical protein
MSRALDVPEAERRAWVEAAAGGDPPVVAEVMRLLDAHEGAGGFLDRPLLAEKGVAAAVESALTAGAGNRPGPGATLGR